MKTAIVIGSTGGIGSELVKALGQDGYKVVGVSKSGYIKCDLTNLKQIHSAITSIKESAGKVDLLINSAGVAIYKNPDPRVRQSGTALKYNTHITKRGSLYLRRDIYIGATIASRWDPQMHEYLEKKLGEGKHYREAMVATSRKLLNRVYAV